MVGRKRVRRATGPQEWEQLTPEALTEDGRTAFERGDYGTAIQAWRRAWATLVAEGGTVDRLQVALAEAHFRRGVSALPGGLDDLAEAVHLAPDEARYQYHLALAHHRRGELKPAIAAYRSLLERELAYTRAAFPLAVALVASGRQPFRDPVWQWLSPDEQERIFCARALASGRPGTMLPSTLRRGADALWPGLVAYWARDPAAQTLLRTALDDPSLPHRAAGVVHHYLGVLAWQQGQHTEALAHWRIAMQDGLRQPWLLQNLAAACQHEALLALDGSRGPRTSPPSGLVEATQPPHTAECLPVGGMERGSEGEPDAGTLRGVLQLVEEGLHVVPQDEGLNEIRCYVRGQLGYRAALAGEWATAVEHLWAAHQSGDVSRALLTNAALASEATNRFAQAAGLWAQVIRHRPRKSGSPDALTKEQMARLWRRVGDAYTRAGDYEEAARAFRNSIRHSPDDQTLRLALVQALVNDERPAAALSAVDQILVAHPDHAEARAWQAHAYELGGYAYAALQSWEKVLELEPQHASAHQNIGRLNRLEGDYRRGKGDLRRAIIAYRHGLRHTPNDARLQASLGLCYSLQGDTALAHETLNAVTSQRSHDTDAHYWTIWAWLTLGEWEEAQTHLMAAEVLEPPPPPDFYFQLASWCAARGLRQWAAELLEMAEKHTPDNVDALLALADALRRNRQDDRAARCLERALRLQPERAEIHLQLGLDCLARDDGRIEAEQHFLAAETLARQSHDAEVLMQVRVGKALVRMGGDL
jgi:tetratricopeptide (TPR) repeat protein